MKILISDSREENCRHFSSYDRRSSDPVGKIQMVSSTKPQGDSAGATPAHRQASILQTWAAYRATVFQEV